MADARKGMCSHCKAKPITEIRYVCLVCKNHKLCEGCCSRNRVTGQHQSTHPTQKVAPLVADRSNAKLYCCPLCGASGFTGQSLLKHVDRLHLKDRKLVHCPICVVSRTRRQQSALPMHLYGDHPELTTDSLCTVCSGAFVRYGCLVCENYQLCSKCRMDKSCSKDHQPYHPMQLIPPLMVNRSNVESKLVKCPYCGKDEFTIHSLSDHCSLQHSSDTLAVRCPVCIVRRVPGGFGELLNSKEPGQLRKHLQQAHNLRIMDEECSICIDEIAATGGRILGCGHRFHVKCIATWLVGHSSCPICRKIVASG